MKQGIGTRFIEETGAEDRYTTNRVISEEDRWLEGTPESLVREPNYWKNRMQDIPPPSVMLTGWFEVASVIGGHSAVHAGAEPRNWEWTKEES